MPRFKLCTLSFIIAGFAFGQSDFSRCAQRLEDQGFTLRPLTAADIPLVGSSFPEPTPRIPWQAVFAASRVGAIALVDETPVGIAVAERIPYGLKVRRLQELPRHKQGIAILNGLLAQLEESVEEGDVLALQVSEFNQGLIGILEARQYLRIGQPTTTSTGAMFHYSKRIEGTESFSPRPVKSDPLKVSIKPEAGDYDAQNLNPRRYANALHTLNQYEARTKLPRPATEDLALKVRLGRAQDPYVAATLAYEPLPGEFRIRFLGGTEAEAKALIRNLLREARARRVPKITAYIGDEASIALWSSFGFESEEGNRMMWLELSNVEFLAE